MATRLGAMHATPPYKVAPSHDRMNGVRDFSYDSTEKNGEHFYVITTPRTKRESGVTRRTPIGFFILQKKLKN